MEKCLEVAPIYFLIAGALTAFLAELVRFLWNWINKQFLEKKENIRNLCFELNYNLKTIDKNLEELHQYEKHILTDSINSYFFQFTLHNVITVTINQLYSQNVLYDGGFEHQEIEGLMLFLSLFNFNTNAQISGRISFYKNNYITDLTLKSGHLHEIQIWRTQLQECKVSLQSLLYRLKREWNIKEFK